MNYEYHVAMNGEDRNEGTMNAPFRSISAAARIAQPGDTITVHAGTYREQICPPRGGLSDECRITYQAALGETVVVTGSEIITGWQPVGGALWRVTVSNKLFGDFNPYGDIICGDWFIPGKRAHHTGAVYLNGHWLDEAATLEELTAPGEGSPLWFARVDDSSTTIWARFPGIDPNEASVEINVRRTVFTPSRPNIDYITLRGFTLCNAATPWAPPTAGQIGLVSAYWCKGWIIEGNDIAYSRCVGIALGKYSDEWDNRCETAEGYVETIRRALTNGWNKEIVGGHVVRNNHIHHCEQNGIVGSLGCAFSRITGNEIHDIHLRRTFDGVEMAGIKFHGAVDVEIRGNHIYRTSCGIWLDWMAQGACVCRNLLHDNTHPEPVFGDLLLEANHGPCMVANNILLSPHAVSICESHDGNFIYNFIRGQVSCVERNKRDVPRLEPHDTAIQCLETTRVGGDRWTNNLFAKGAIFACYGNEKIPVTMEGNIFLQSHAEGISLPIDLGDLISSAQGGCMMDVIVNKLFEGAAPKENGPVELESRFSCVAEDYLGTPRYGRPSFPGPLALSYAGKHTLQIWLGKSNDASAGNDQSKTIEYHANQ